MRYLLGLLSILLIFLPSATFSQGSYYFTLVEGKKSLAKGDFVRAEEFLTKSLAEFKEIGDYILLWRAYAYNNLQKYEEALRDIEELKKNYPRSTVIKEGRKLELEIAKTLKLNSLGSIYDSFVSDYPEEVAIKFEYATYLKEKRELEKAKRLFKEIFLTPSSFADKAEEELSANDISADDLLKKGRILNNAYLFKKAERYLREALQRIKGSQNTEFLSALGYCLFMQKKYVESAEIFKRSRDFYWRARSLLRAKDFETFERELPEYLKSSDIRMADVFINYANIKRRAGLNDEGIRILKMVVSKYPEAKEEAMWNMAWNYYTSGQYEEGRRILQELYDSYGKPKYFYWLDRINEKKGVVPTKKYTFQFRQGDVYSYLLYMKGKTNLVPETSKIRENITLNRRLEILIKAGFREEALREIKTILKDNRDMENIPIYSRLLYELGDYPTSVRLISKFPNRFSYQELLYPRVYEDSVLKASKRFNLDAYLIFAIMREESRFDRLAQSPAGALGLMQLMPDTARREGSRIGVYFRKDSEIFEQEKNILVGSAYLKNLIEEFGNIVFAIAAYNAGEKAVSSWLKNYSYKEIDEFMEDIPFAETRNYVQKVLSSYFEYLRGNRNLTAEHISEIIKIRGGKL